MEPIGVLRVGNATKPCKITRVGEGRRERRRGGTKVEKERKREREGKREERKRKAGNEAAAAVGGDSWRLECGLGSP